MYNTMTNDTYNLYRAAFAKDAQVLKYEIHTLQNKVLHEYVVYVDGTLIQYTNRVRWLGAGHCKRFLDSGARIYDARGNVEHVSVNAFELPELVLKLRYAIQSCVRKRDASRRVNANVIDLAYRIVGDKNAGLQKSYGGAGAQYSAFCQGRIIVVSPEYGYIGTASQYNNLTAAEISIVYRLIENAYKSR